METVKHPPFQLRYTYSGYPATFYIRSFYDKDAAVDSAQRRYAARPYRIFTVTSGETEIARVPEAIT